MNEMSGHSLVKPERITDDALLELVQRQTFGYFWDFAHPKSGMARDRSGPDGCGTTDLLAVGGTGFGIMAMIVAVERGWISRAEAVGRLLDMLDYLKAAEQYNGVFPHYLDGPTGKEVSFWPDNAGGDLVESSYLVQGLAVRPPIFLRARHARRTAAPRRTSTDLWGEAELELAHPGRPEASCSGIGAARTELGARPRGFEGWNECLITYVLAAAVADATRSRPDVYHRGLGRRRAGIP